LLAIISSWLDHLYAKKMRPETRPGAPVQQALTLDDEEQENGDQEGENTEALGERDADEHAPELAIGGRRIAQSAQKELAKDNADADCGRARSDRGKTCAD
jgi:hypothetical protein